jgi:4-hydroxy-tetrahydrodipicolinate synthase
LYTHQLIGPVSDLATYRSILSMWGLHGGYCRDPFYPLTAEQEKKLRGILEQTGWMDPEHALDGT